MVKIRDIAIGTALTLGFLYVVNASFNIKLYNDISKRVQVLEIESKLAEINGIVDPGNETIDGVAKSAIDERIQVWQERQDRAKVRIYNPLEYFY